MTEPIRRANYQQAAESMGAESATGSQFMLRQATWCGIVSSLAVLLTALNLVPPVSIRYTVVANAVVNQARLDSLQALVDQQNQLANSSATNSANIRGIKVLDRSDDQHLSTGSLQKQELILVEIESAWSERCSETSYAGWLDSLPVAGSGRMTETVAAKELRLARWELSIAKHYAKHNQRHAADAREGQSDALSLARAANGKQPSGRRLSASLASHAPQDSLPSLESEVSSQDAGIEAAQRKLAETELAWKQQIEQSSGALRITGTPTVIPHLGTIPFWMAISVLILGLASGSTAGWVQHRLQSGGVHDPLQVAQQLERQGIPLAGTLGLASGLADAKDWVGMTSHHAGYAGRQTARHLTRLSEALLGFWCTLIVVRMLIDPLWRLVLVDSPLAAYGRLLAGMP